jgi:hypothetical protein
MTITAKSENMRGFQEVSQQVPHLRAKWPKAFPAKSDEIRPLASGIKQTVMEAFGWTPAYTRAVLKGWKLRAAYCQAVLRHKKRINLDGSTSDEEVDDEARRLARVRLDKLAANHPKRAEQTQVSVVTEIIGDPPIPAPATAAIVDVAAKLKLEPAPPAEAPKSGKLIVAGSAAMAAALKRRLANGPVTTEVMTTVAAPAARGKRDRHAVH